MPGSVALAVAVTVLPLSLSSAFSHSREYAIRENIYKNGESQRLLLTASSRKRWKLGKRLTSDELTELRDFYDARGGGLEAFLFYDVYETDPKFSYDETGVATDGRHKVHFVGEWQQTVD